MAFTRGLAAGVLIGALAGCVGSTAPPGPTPAGPSSLAERSAPEILAATRSASQQAASFRASGVVPGLDASEFDGVFTATASRGEVRGKTSTFRVVVVDGRVFLKGDRSLYTEYGAKPKLVGTRWLVLPAADPRVEQLAGLLNGPAFVNAILDSATVVDTGLVEYGTSSEPPGVQLITDDGSIWVELADPPYLREVTLDSGRALLVFRGWNQPVTITAPRRAVDIDDAG